MRMPTEAGGSPRIRKKARSTPRGHSDAEAAKISVSRQAEAKPAGAAGSGDWSPEDMTYARAYTPPKSSVRSRALALKMQPELLYYGRVYVRGYVRRDGTYVSPTTRHEHF